MVTILIGLALLLGGLGAGYVGFMWWAKRQVPRVCGNCAHFDLREGQAAIAQFPHFMRYAQHVSPKRSGDRFERDDDGEVVQVVTSPIPERCAWEDFGACRKHSAILWQEQPVDDEASACRGANFRRAPRAQLRVLP